jgi:hypothetical protein
MPQQPVPEDWVVSTELELNGASVDANTEITFSNAHGRFTFVKHVKSSTSEWVDVRDSEGRFRSFQVGRIVKIHQKPSVVE